ncbi:MAG: GldG family protein [Tissierellia bacterium]|nr:GldG family protein [Tissierellia bacterium]
MDKLEVLKKSWQREKDKIALRGGSYSLIMTAIVLAILIMVNVLVSSLPTPLTRYDISAEKLYSITSNTKVVVNGLEEDVTIYWIVQSGEEDHIIENLLDKYDSLSDHIRVEKKNPDVYPTFAKQYTHERVKNNSLIVESGERSRFISYDDIYIREPNIYTFSSSTYFDGEGAITSAIDYVTREELPQLYLLEGHGEAELPSAFKEQIERDNIEINTLSLLKVDSIPEDAAAIMIYAPESDISHKEKDLLADYVKEGGKLLVVAGPTEDGILENLYALLADYGVKAHEGIVVEGAREHYAFQTPLMLLPEMKKSEITDPLIEENYYPLMPVSIGLTIDEAAAGGRVTSLLNTSQSAFSKLAGFNISTYEKEEGDIDGPFAVAVSVESGQDGKMVWFTSSSFLEDMYNAYSSGANVNLGMNALSYLIGEREAVAIRSKSLDYEYLTISDSTSFMLKVIMIGLFPILYLAIGIYVIIRRRRLQSEAV